MDKIIRDAQLKLLGTFAGGAKTFALSGGTALELFYLKHRFSRDLDFFSPAYNLSEIDKLVSVFSKTMGAPVTFEAEFFAPSHAKVRFYNVKIKESGLPLKIDFVEDVFFKKPSIKRFDGIPVYNVKNIYSQKIFALIGTCLAKDKTGREITTGRKEARDIVDLYYLSKNIEALHKFVRILNREQQRGIIQWYRSYSRQETKLGVLDLDLYDKKIDVSEMIRYLDTEVKKFMAEVLE